MANRTAEQMLPGNYTGPVQHSAEDYAEAAFTSQTEGTR